jgi:hypothetical protein
MAMLVQSEEEEPSLCLLAWRHLRRPQKNGDNNFIGRKGNASFISSTDSLQHTQAAKIPLIVHGFLLPTRGKDCLHRLRLLIDSLIPGETTLAKIPSSQTHYAQ